MLCRVLFIDILSDVILSAVMLSVAMVSVVAPCVMHSHMHTPINHVLNTLSVIEICSIDQTINETSLCSI
jgi:hypothetical protein